MEALKPFWTHQTTKTLKNVMTSLPPESPCRLQQTGTVVPPDLELLSSSGSYSAKFEFARSRNYCDKFGHASRPAAPIQNLEGPLRPFGQGLPGGDGVRLLFEVIVA